MSRHVYSCPDCGGKHIQAHYVLDAMDDGHRLDMAEALLHGAGGDPDGWDEEVRRLWGPAVELLRAEVEGNEGATA